MDAETQALKKPYAVVFALDTMNGLQTARSLARWDIPVIGIANDARHPFCHSNACDEIVVTNTQNEDLINTLEVLGKNFGQKAVLFPCNNVEMLLVSRYRKRLEFWYHVVLSEPDVDEMLMNKTRFYDFAQKEGFPIPRTYYLNNKSDAEKAANELVFPCIIKPAIRSSEWEQKSPLKAYKAITADEFLTLYDSCKKWSKDLIVQEWIEGPESNLYTCYCYFNHDSKPLVTFVTRKIRQWPPETGEGCLGEECRNDVVLQETVRLFRSAHLYGIGYLEMKCDSRTGKYYIIEPNIGRLTSKSALAESGGVELLYTMYCDALGWDLPTNREQKYGNVKWIFFRRDLLSALYNWRKGELSVKDWLQSIRGIKIEAVFSRQDPAPFFYDLIYSIFTYLSPNKRRKSNYRNPFPKNL
jgi:D-aspartate ligase